MLTLLRCSSPTYRRTINDLPVPTQSTQQTSALILDVDKDGVNDFVIAARRTPGPSLVWYRRDANGWTKFVIDRCVLDIEAGGDYYDIDDDGDLDIVMGGDYRSNEVWWWENPYPDLRAQYATWTRRLIKNRWRQQASRSDVWRLRRRRRGRTGLLESICKEALSGRNPDDPTSRGMAADAHLYVGRTRRARRVCQSRYRWRRPSTSLAADAGSNIMAAPTLCQDH